MSYSHLTLEERIMLGELRKRGHSLRAIAAELGRSPSTVSRELRRNQRAEKWRKRYFPHSAQRQYQARIRQERCGKYGSEPLARYVQEKLLLTWSPEQIAGRIRLDFPEDATMRICHSTIYRWLHRGQLTQAAALKLKLRHHGHRHGETRGRLNGVRDLRERSKLALRRKRFGDWEVDTIISGVNRKDCLLSVCDRKSRYCGLVLLKRRSAPEVLRGFRVLFGSGALPLESITADRGTEFACHREVEAIWGIPFYFTRPRAPWQKPSVENLNGLVRQFFPKATDFAEISQDQVARVMHTLNNRPRKTLGFKTPHEVLHLT